MSESLLRVEDAAVEFDGVVALAGVRFEVSAGEIVGVVGPLGAGKTTLLRVAAGTLLPDRGQAVFAGASLGRLAAGEAARRGVLLVPAGGGIFPTLTVRENLQLAQPGRRAFPDADVEGVFSRFPVLSARPGQVAGSLSGGEQRQLALARAALAHPQVLLLDEPLLGLAPLVADAVAGLLRELAASGTAVVIVEERPTRVLTGLATRLFGLRLGRVVPVDSLQAPPPVAVGGASRAHDAVEVQAVRVPLTVAQKRDLQTLAAASGETVGELLARLARDHVHNATEMTR